jgi:hypothetical protein
MAENERKKNLTWIPWTISAIVLLMSLLSHAVSYGADNKTLKDTVAKIESHCVKQEVKEKETDTVLEGIKIQLAVAQEQNKVTQSQNGMVLESLAALREELKEMRKK